MNNLKLESGFTQIPNELLETIYSTKLNATQLKIILVVWRYTYGFHRENHSLSISFFVKATGVSRRHISSELQNLIKMNILKVIKKSSFTNSRQIEFNKNYNEWCCKVIPQVNNNSTGEQLSTTTDEEHFTTTDEEYFTQEINNINKNINKNICAFFENLWKLYPNKKGKQSVSKKSLKEINEIGYDEMTRCINRYIDTKPEWQNYQNGSTFFNSGYVDYLDCNYEDEDKTDKYDLPVITSETIKQIEQTNNQNFRTVEQLKNMTLEEMFS